MKKLKGFYYLICILAKSAGQTLHYDQHTEGGWTLYKHWNSDITLEKIRKGNWDVVVIQEHR